MQMKNLRDQPKLSSWPVKALFRPLNSALCIPYIMYCRVLMRIPPECLSFNVFILFYSVLAAFDDHKSVFKILNTSVIKNGNSCAIVACNFLRLTDWPTAHSHTPMHIHMYIHTYVKTCLTLGSGNLWAPSSWATIRKWAKRTGYPAARLPVSLQSVLASKTIRKQSSIERERQRRGRETERERERKGVDGHLSRALFIVSPLEHVENLIKLRLDSSIVCESFECKQ